MYDARSAGMKGHLGKPLMIGAMVIVAVIALALVGFAVWWTQVRQLPVGAASEMTTQIATIESRGLEARVAARLEETGLNEILPQMQTFASTRQGLAACIRGFPDAGFKRYRDAYLARNAPRFAALQAKRDEMARINEPDPTDEQAIRRALRDGSLAVDVETTLRASASDFADLSWNEPDAERCRQLLVEVQTGRADLPPVR